MTQRILVTGASGFIAGHCIVDLLNNGYAVRGTVRNLDRAQHLKEIILAHTDSDAGELEYVQAELTDSEPWKSAMADCDGVFHVASPVPVEQPDDADEIIVPAREGTLNVLTAAAEAGIKRVVLTSSVAAVSNNAEGHSRVQTSDDWTDLSMPNLTPYVQSKTYAEQAAWDFVKDADSLELATINPALVLGPALEADYGSSLEAILKPMRGDYPMVPKLGFGIVDVRDVAILHRLVYEHPLSAGHRFIASNGFRTLLDICNTVREQHPEFNKQLPRRELPNFLTRILARFDKVIGSFIDDIGQRTEYDIEPATSIGWQPRSAEIAIQDGAKSLVEHGVVTP
jgi:dihydroflavonol-4-reductase